MKNKWRVIHNSVIGASHKRSGKPNQDRFQFFPVQEHMQQPPLIVSIADGHGGKKYVRSGEGAEIAVNVAVDVCSGLEKIQWDIIKDKKNITLLCRDIVQRWVDRVNLNILSNPFTEDEINLLAISKEPPKKIPLGINNDNNISAYGSTLLIVVIQDSYIFYLQLGDGDILVINSDGVIEKPIPEDKHLLGNETTSLCLPEAWSDFRSNIFQINQDSIKPAFILLSTDGYKNSYRGEKKYFEKAAEDMLEIICEHPDGIQAGMDYIEENLEKWLTDVSEKGSGDDITVGIICNIGQIETYRDTVYPLKKQRELDELKSQEKPPLDKEEIHLPEISSNPDNGLMDIVENSSDSQDKIVDQL